MPFQTILGGPIPDDIVLASFFVLLRPPYLCAHKDGDSTPLEAFTQREVKRGQDRITESADLCLALRSFAVTATKEITSDKSNVDF